MINFIKKLFRARPVFSNTAEGTHTGVITRTLESTIEARYLIGKTGSTASTVALCDADESPLGVVCDTGEPGELVSVNLLSTAASTVLMIASEAITAGQDVYTANAGKIQNQPTTAGTYYQVGRALTTSTGNNAVIEVEPCAPRKVVVSESFSGDSEVDIATLTTILRKAPDKVVMLPLM
ncbi:DUF2190 family protein [Ruficoccus sp. ZRK36]|uniref:DUF2190 family protein n=1 Tax=Ruficoccus sp. ZRK36 TaxID=2866311 RepID=UPI001C7327BB|nr:DUF2190 family protein [Ruficoccus sp. ZRK36]QYY34768.1 DUF2190 family protein [Ruficoccus sp. ZRK36]